MVFKVPRGIVQPFRIAFRSRKCFVEQFVQFLTSKMSIAAAALDRLKATTP
jgi:hypothetical protein